LYVWYQPSDKQTYDPVGQIRALTSSSRGAVSHFLSLQSRSVKNIQNISDAVWLVLFGAGKLGPATTGSWDYPAFS